MSRVNYFYLITTVCNGTIQSYDLRFSSETSEGPSPLYSVCPSPQYYWSRREDLRFVTPSKEVSILSFINDYVGKEKIGLLLTSHFYLSSIQVFTY